MNWEQLKAILWLRQRLSINQWRKAGTINFVLMVVFFVSMLSFAAVSFFVALGLGIFLLPRATPTIVMVVWDIAVAVLLVGWATSLLIDIQRMELFSMNNFLHLPMSLRDAFLMNYLASLFNLNIVCFVPATLGFCLALAIVHGPLLLWLIPVLLSSILALTALTYQFRGWLSAWMIDKRRQRTAITFVTLGFVALTQIPTLALQFQRPSRDEAKQQLIEEHNSKTEALLAELMAEKITQADHTQRLAELEQVHQTEREQLRESRIEGWRLALMQVNQIVPAGWLPMSSYWLLERSWWPASLYFLALTAVGATSLWRSYVSTVRHYTGKLAVQNRVRASVSPSVGSARPTTGVTTAGVTTTGVTTATGRPDATQATVARTSLLERTLPWVSEHTSAVSMLSFRSFMRAPETKMMLIGPFILVTLFLVMVLANRIPRIPVDYYPLVWLAGVPLVMFMSIMLMMNIFGLDRGGFRSFVLMPIPRSEILLGKNLSLFPICAVLMLLFSAACFYLAPVNLWHVLACGCQMLIAFWAASLIGNIVSLYFPFAMTHGTGKPVQVNLIMVIARMVAMFVGPLVVLPGLLLYGIEWGVNYYFPAAVVPIFFLLSLLELWLATLLYRYLIAKQGELLQERETRILEVLGMHSE